MKEKTTKKTQDNEDQNNDFPIVEIWNTYQTLAELIAPRLRAFKNHDQHGFCADFKDTKEWKGAIQKMIDAFELLIDEDKIGIFSDEQEEAIEQGLDIFRKYFRQLWD